MIRSDSDIERHRGSRNRLSPCLSSLFHLGTSEAGVEMEFPNFMEDQRIAVTDAPICQYEAGYLKGEGLKGKKKKAGLMCRACYYLPWYAVAPPK